MKKIPETLKEAETHLLQAMCERSCYRTAVKECRDRVHQKFTTDGVLCLPPPGTALASGSGPDSAHYSFDLRECAVFGVCCEGIPRQVNYLIDEASDTGKGANTVVSLLHHFF
jgi:hypothetical protein